MPQTASYQQHKDRISMDSTPSCMDAFIIVFQEIWAIDWDNDIVWDFKDLRVIVAWDKKDENDEWGSKDGSQEVFKREFSSNEKSSVHKNDNEFKNDDDSVS